MFEFPLSVRYNISDRFFAGAGLTSYIMKHESYDYMANAGGMVYPGYRSYKHSGDHLFSNLQLSGGYDLKLKQRFKIRIEPYIKLPLKNIGIGKMPITSSGVYFGLMRYNK